MKMAIVKSSLAGVTLMTCCLLLGCGKHAPNAAPVQTAVSQVVEWARLSGDVQVLGIQENPEANEATADLQFNDFQYKANNMGTPIAKTTPPPREPEVNSPSFYQELASWPSRQFSVTSYSGRGTATMKRYNDGRWMLTGVQFNFQQFNSNVPISR